MDKILLGVAIGLILGLDIAAGIAFWWWMRLTPKGWQGKPDQKVLIEKVNASRIKEDADTKAGVQ